MTISAVTNRVSYDGDGSSVNFAVSFPFHAKADLVVIETIIATGVQTTKTLTTHYTITGTADALGHYPNGGTVVAVTAPAATARWTIYRDPGLTQSVDLVEGADLPVESAVESPLDRLTMIAQRSRDLLARSLRQPDGDTANIAVLPAKVIRASKYLTFNSAGDPTATTGTPSSSDGLNVVGIVFSTDYATLNAAVTAIAATVTTLVVTGSFPVTANTTVPATLTLRFVGQGALSISAGVTATINGSLIAPPLQIFTGSGTASFTSNSLVSRYYIDWWGTNAAAFQAAIDAMPTGAVLHILPKTYTFSTTRIRVNRALTIEGEGWNSLLSWDVTALSDPGNEWSRAALNVRFDNNVPTTAIPYFILRDVALDFGGNASSIWAEGRRGVHLFSVNDIHINRCKFKGGPGFMVLVSGDPQPNRINVTGSWFTDWNEVALNPTGDYAYIAGNTFLTGKSGIESAGRSQKIIGNHFETLAATAISVNPVSGGGYAAVVGNMLRNTRTTDPSATAGAIIVLGGGVSDPMNGFIVSENFIWNDATYANQNGILVTRGTSTSDHTDGSITNNVIRGLRSGIKIASLLDGLVSGNTLRGDGTTMGSGVLFGASNQVKRLAIQNNNIRGYNARTAGITTNGPITDLSAETDANVVGWNVQENVHILGVTGRIDFANLDATPSVRRPAGIYVVSNSGATTITQLDNGYRGQVVHLFFVDANTTINDAGNFKLSAGFTSAADKSLTLVAQDDALWVEISRSAN